jgi:ligand-binding sensor domain-containing protein
MESIMKIIFQTKIILFLIILFPFNVNSQTLSKWVVFDSTNSPFPKGGISSIVQDKEGYYWISFFEDWVAPFTYIGGGILRTDFKNWEFFNKQNSPLSSNAVTFIAIDSLGNKWIATSDSGLIKFTGTQWIKFNKSNSAIPTNSIWSLTIERDTIVWIAAWGDGVIKYDGLNWKKYDITNSPLTSGEINFVKIDNTGIKWIGTDYGPLYSFDNTNWKIHAKPPLSTPYLNNFTKALDFDKDWNKWIAAHRGPEAGLPPRGIFAMLKDTTWSFYDSAEVGFRFINSYHGITVDKNNIKWATIRDGLLRYNDTTWFLFSQANSPIKSAGVIITNKYNNKVFAATLAGSGRSALVFYNENGVVLTSVNEKNYLPAKFILYQNYPNPFNSVTKISFTVPASDWISLKVYDIMGREIRTLLDKYKNPGEYIVPFDASASDGLSSGVYVYVLKSSSFIELKRMVLLK